jgi:hypothetical protein
VFYQGRKQVARCFAESLLHGPEPSGQQIAGSLTAADFFGPGHEVAEVIRL